MSEQNQVFTLLSGRRVPPPKPPAETLARVRELRHRLRVSAADISSAGYTPRAIGLALVAEGLELLMAGGGIAGASHDLSRLGGYLAGSWVPENINLLIADG